MNNQIRKRQRSNSNEEQNNNYNSSFEVGQGYMYSMNGTGKGNNSSNIVNDELKLKMAALESENARLKADNKVLEGCKLENLELRTQIGVLTEANNTLKLTKDAEQIIANNQKLALLEVQQKEMANNLDKRMEHFEIKFASMEERHGKEIAELTAKNQEVKEELTKKIAFLERQLWIHTKIDLPTETWMDIFCFLSRPWLAQIVPQIGNWYFVSKAQYCLHECGRIILGKLWIQRPTNGPGTIVANQTEQELLLEDFPMPIPENVKNFKEIFIYTSAFDKSILRFLHEFRRNSLFDNANLTFFNISSLVELASLMANLGPLFTNINSISLVGTDVLPIFQNEYTELAMPMLASAKVLKTRYNSRNDWFCAWLKTPRPDEMPRILVLYIYELDCPISSIIEYLKKDFLEAKQAISFFIHLIDINFYALDGPIPELFTAENHQTKEKFVVTKGKTDSSWISRHPMEANAEWIEEMTKYEYHYEYGNIAIEF